MYSRGPQDHSRESMGVKYGGQKDSPPHFREGEYCVLDLVERGGFEPPTSRLQAGKRGKKDDSANATTFRTFALEGHFSL